MRRTANTDQRYNIAARAAYETCYATTGGVGGFAQLNALHGEPLASSFFPGEIGAAGVETGAQVTGEH
jgi:hypothetical protein